VDMTRNVSINYKVRCDVIAVVWTDLGIDNGEVRGKRTQGASSRY
jgi:hypothetical protein